MVEAGGDQVPEETMLEAFELAQAEIRQDLRSARGPAGAGRQAEVGRLRAHGRARGRAQGRRFGQRSPSTGFARPLPSSTRSSPAPRRRSPWPPPRTTWFGGHRSARASRRSSRRPALAAVEGPVREQFLADLRELTDAEQDSKELRSAKRDLLFDRILEELTLPFPVGQPPAGGRAGGQGLGDEAVHQACLRGGLQGPRPEEDRSRQAPPGRALGGGDPSRRVRGRGEPPHARLGALHARPDADHDAC